MEGSTYKLQQKVVTANGHINYLDIGSAYNKGQLFILKELAIKYKVENPDIELRMLERSTKVIGI